jgi:hypothetical protein
MIVLNSVNWLIFIMEKHCVYCEVGIEFMCIIFINFMIQAVNMYVEHNNVLFRAVDSKCLNFESLRRNSIAEILYRFR